MMDKENVKRILESLGGGGGRGGEDPEDLLEEDNSLCWDLKQAVQSVFQHSQGCKEVHNIEEFIYGMAVGTTVSMYHRDPKLRILLEVLGEEESFIEFFSNKIRHSLMQELDRLKADQRGG